MKVPEVLGLLLLGVDGQLGRAADCDPRRHELAENVDLPVARLLVLAHHSVHVGTESLVRCLFALHFAPLESLFPLVEFLLRMRVLALVELVGNHREPAGPIRKPLKSIPNQMLSEQAERADFLSLLGQL